MFTATIVKLSVKKRTVAMGSLH